MACTSLKTLVLIQLSIVVLGSLSELSLVKGIESWPLDEGQDRSFSIVPLFLGFGKSPIPKRGPSTPSPVNKPPTSSPAKSSPPPSPPAKSPPQPSPSPPPPSPPPPSPPKSPPPPPPATSPPPPSPPPVKPQPPAQSPKQTPPPPPTTPSQPPRAPPPPPTSAKLPVTPPSPSPPAQPPAKQPPPPPRTAQPPIKSSPPPPPADHDESPAVEPPPSPPTDHEPPLLEPPPTNQPPLIAPSPLPPTMTPPFIPPITPPVKLPPPSINPPGRPLIVVGRVYCKACNSRGLPTLYRAYPLQGAVVKLVCHKTARNAMVQSAITDKSGEFVITPMSLTRDDIHKCKVYLGKSPKPICSVPTNFNDGKSGALLKPVLPPKQPATPVPGLHVQPLAFDFHGVGPFVFEASNKFPCKK